MSTKVFYTFYITKTPSQTGFGCRKSVENPVENRVENPCAPALRSQFGNGGLGVLTHRPSVCCQGGPRPGCHLTCRACLRGPCPVRHLRSQFGNTGLVVLTHQPCAAMRRHACAPDAVLAPCATSPHRSCVPVSASLQRVLGQEPAPVLIGPDGLTWGASQQYSRRNHATGSWSIRLDRRTGWCGATGWCRHIGNYVW